MNSPVIKRSIVINDHKTSVSLEDAFWNSLKDLALRQHITLSKMVGELIYIAETAICPFRHPVIRA